MKRFFTYNLLLCLIIFILSGCSPTGAKTENLTIIYGITAICSLIILIAYCCFIRQKELWFLLLFASICVVNLGYFSLSISKNLNEALLANRISYLGSVFLPMSMLMIILHVLNYNYKKWVPILLFSISMFVFFIAASPGYLDIYYKEVTLFITNGVTSLNKVYGPWHSLYLCFLLSHFGSMVYFIVYATLKKNSAPFVHAIILAGAVFVNIGVWFIEQLIDIKFELLSVSYIICELFLLGLNIILQEHEVSRHEILRENANTSKHETLNKNTDVSTHETLSESTDASKHEALCENTDNRIPEFSVSHADASSDILVISTDTLSKDIPSQIITEEQQSLLEFYRTGINKLTKTEHIIFNHYISGKKSREILEELSITENTLKFHNKNIYSKLGVNSRKQMLEMYKNI